MKFLHILGTVIALHVAIFLLAFVMPGCRSTTRTSPKPADTTAPGYSSNSPAPASYPTDAAPSSASPLSPSPTYNDSSSLNAPAVSFGSPDSSTRYNPTRPGNPAADSFRSPAVDVTQATTYTVVRGDSLWSVARKHGIKQSELTAANNLAPGAPLGIGQKLIIPLKTSAPVADSAPAVTGDVLTYTVRTGDSLSSIAQRAGTTVAAIKTLNRLNNDIVRPGQELTLPAGEATASALASAPAPSAPTPVSKTTVTHTVRSGESLSQIARKYGVSLKEIATLNRISDPRKMPAGKVLTIPGVKPSALAPEPATPALNIQPVVEPVRNASPVSSPFSTPSPVSPASDQSPIAPTPDFIPPVVPVEEANDSPFTTPGQ